MARSWDKSANILLPDGKPVIGPRLGRVFQVLSETLIPDGGKLPLSVSQSISYEFFAKYLRDHDVQGRDGVF